MWTAATPSSITESASSSFAIMPPVTVPSAIAARASARVNRVSRDAGSLTLRRTPGADVTVSATYPYSIDILGWVVKAGNLTSSTHERLE